MEREILSFQMVLQTFSKLYFKWWVFLGEEPQETIVLCSFLHGKQLVVILKKEKKKKL